MDDSKDTLAQALSHAPETPFGLDDVRDRRGRVEQRRRLTARIVGLGLTTAILGAVVFAMVSSGTREGTLASGAGGGLPAPSRTVSFGPGEFSYQRIRIGVDFTCSDCGVKQSGVVFESWWALDDSGRIDVTERNNYGIHGGTFAPGTFPNEGDLSAFPTEPDALRAFLLERSATDGASPRPEVTPAPDVPLEEGQLWLAIRDYLGSTQYLNATPELRAAMLQVLARVPMVDVQSGTTDPLGRPATALRFHAYDADVTVFVDPETDDFLAMTERFDDGSTGSIVVEEAGIAANDHARPQGVQRTVQSAP